MKTIDVQEVVDYCYCPMFYYLRYLEPDVKDETVSVAEKYNRDLHRTIYAFYSMIQNHAPARIETLKRSWGTMWIGKRGTEEFVVSTAGSWRDTHNERRKRGIQAIVKFYDNFKGKEGFPLAINTPYTIQINEDLQLTGVWELIREVEVEPGKREIQLLAFTVDDKTHNTMRADKDLGLSAASLAFREAFNRKEDACLIYGMEKGKFQRVTRDQNEYALLKYTVDCVAKNIEDRRFPVCPGEQCYSCLYRNKCKKLLNDEAKLSKLCYN